MSSVLQSRLNELRFIDGIEKVEHVPYRTGDQFWVRFNRPLDFKKLDELCKKHGYTLIKFGGLPSKLPGRLVEVLWDGVSHVIVKKMSGLTKLTASLGLEPEGVAKIATDLHGPYQIFMAMNEEGVQILYDYLGLKYVQPPPPPKPVIPAKPAIPAAKPPTPPPTAAPKPAPTNTPPTPATTPPTAPTAVAPTVIPQPNTAQPQTVTPVSPPQRIQPQTEKKPASSN